MVPRYVGARPLRRAADSASGGSGEGRVGAALLRLGKAEKARAREREEEEAWERERRARLVARGRRRAEFMVGVRACGEAERREKRG